MPTPHPQPPVIIGKGGVCVNRAAHFAKILTTLPLVCDRLGGMGIPFVRDMQDFDYGVCARLSPRIRRVIAHNPGPFTYTGTGTYIVGTGEVAVIDPGPKDEAHVDALLAALGDGERVSHILITHTHNDHSPAAALLKARTGAPTYGFGPHGSGHREKGAPAVEAGGDMDFAPDHLVKDGDVIKHADWTLACVYTPGHTSNHMCFALREERVLFPGDHVMGWSTTVIAPPDGNMGDYMDSLDKLRARDDETYWPTHGPAITEPKIFLKQLIAHRKAREEQILACLRRKMHKIADMVPVMYAETDAVLHPAAALSVLAHVQGMVKDGRIRTDKDATLSAEYRLP